MTDKTKNKAAKHESDAFEEFKKSEELESELRMMKEKFKEAESIANFGFWELDPVTLNPTWTDGLFKIVGYDPEYGQLNYYDQKKLVHPEDWDHFYNSTQTVVTTGKEVEFEIRVIRPDGSTRLFNVIAKPKKDREGKVISVRGTAQDITYLKKIENDLRESEAFYRTLFENTGAASVIFDEDSTILMANTQFENISGYSKGEIEGQMNCKEVIAKEDQEIMEKYHYMRINDIGLPPQNYEAHLIDKYGKKRTVLINVAVIPGTKKTIASLTDLTGLKMAESILQTTLKRFYTILENMRASVLLVTEENIIEFANHAFCEYFNLNELPEDLIGLTADEMIKNIKNSYKFPGEEIKRIRGIVGDWKPVLGEEIHMSNESTCIRDFIPIFVDSKPYGRLWLHLDITERKKMEKELADSEKRYRYIVEKATAGMFILDKNGIIKYLNGHMAHMLSYSKNEMLERHIKSFIDEEEEFYRFRKSSEIQIEKYDWFKLLDRQGNIFWSNLTVTPIFNSKNIYNGLLGIVTDINMQKGLEETFLEREEIFTDIIHDMMEMLNNIAKDKKRSKNNEELHKNSENN